MDIKTLPVNLLEICYLIGLNFKSDFEFLPPFFISIHDSPWENREKGKCTGMHAMTHRHLYDWGYALYPQSYKRL